MSNWISMVPAADIGDLGISYLAAVHIGTTRKSLTFPFVRFEGHNLDREMTMITDEETFLSSSPPVRHVCQIEHILQSGKCQHSIQ